MRVEQEGLMMESTGTAGRPVNIAAALLIAALSGACGGGGGSFKAAAPISDVCGLLTTTDIQTVMPGAAAGAEQQTPNTDDLGFWSRDCKWDDSTTATHSIELVVFGATTSQGLNAIKLAAQSGQMNTPVSSLGTQANFWVEDPSIGTSGLWAIDGSQSVDITNYFLTPIPTEAQLHPLVAKVLGEIK